MGHGTNVVLASTNQLNETIGSLTSLATNPKGAPVVATVVSGVTGNTSTAVNNVLGSGPAVSVSSSSQISSLLGSATPGSGGTINVNAGAVNAGANVAGTINAKTPVGNVNAGANVSLGGK
jgi:hypothetical protein